MSHVTLLDRSSASCEEILSEAMDRNNDSYLVFFAEEANVKHSIFVFPFLNPDIQSIAFPSPRSGHRLSLLAPQPRCSCPGRRPGAAWK